MSNQWIDMSLLMNLVPFVPMEMGMDFVQLQRLEKSAKYLEDYQKRCRQNWKRNRRQSSRPQSYDIDMEMADCYFGYSAEDFC